MPKKSPAATEDAATQTFTERMAGVGSGADITLGKIIPHGALVARKQKSGAIAFYWRWTTAGKVDRESIGLFDRKLPPKQLGPVGSFYTVAGAMLAAQKLAQEHEAALEAGLGGLRGARTAEADAEAARKAEAERQATEKVAVEVARLLAEEEQRARAEAALKARSECNLRRLLVAYCDHLAALGRRSHQDARSIFATHVFAPWPELVALPASEITDEQVADILRRIIEKGHHRTAGKCRAYMAAAFELARKARTDAKVPVSLKAYGVRLNPASATAAIGGAAADKNPLTLEELRVYWKAIKDIDSERGAMLRLHLLTGGQRIEQFCRLKTADIGTETILIFDGKGRPAWGRGPRMILLPLVPEARQAIERIAPTGEWALSTTTGKKPISCGTLRKAACEAAASIDEFEIKRVRSTVETVLAAAGVSKDTRGRLQSHGIGGVMDNHYNGHDYVPEKLRALQTLVTLLEADEAEKVVPIRSAA